MNELSRQKLSEIVARYGQDIYTNPQRCEGLLRDFCGQCHKEIFLLVNALKKGVAGELIKSQSKVNTLVILARLTKHLQDELGITEDAAHWAVDSWGLALGVISQPRAKSDFQNQQQQQVEQEQRKKYEEKLRHSEAEIESWKQKVDDLNLQLQQKQKLPKQESKKSVALFAIFSGIATLFLGIYSHQQHQNLSNLQTKYSNLTSQQQILQDKYENDIAKYRKKIRTLQKDSKVKIDDFESSIASLRNDLQNYKNSFKNLEKNINSNPGLPGDTYLEICNNTSSDNIEVALLYRGESGFNSQGWWVVRKGECTKTAVGYNYRGDIYIHGKGNNVNWGSNDFSFCVSNTKFNFTDEAKIACRGENRRVNSIKFLVFPGLNRYNFND
jgi:Protein of unknown function (DUF1036)